MGCNDIFVTCFDQITKTMLPTKKGTLETQEKRDMSQKLNIRPSKKYALCSARETVKTVMCVM